MTLDEKLREQLTSGDDDQRAAGVVAVADALVERLGLSWDAILAAHKRRPYPIPLGLQRSQSRGGRGFGDG
jgi:hypothetical protein